MRTSAAVVALTYLLLSSCSATEPTPSLSRWGGGGGAAESAMVARATPGARVVIVAIDGARWQEIFRGTDPDLAHANGIADGDRETADELVPNIRALARRGVAIGGEDETRFEASGPNFVSLPGYTEILTGRPAPCQENACEARPEKTIADETRALPGVETNDVAVISSWERIDAIAAGDPSRVIVSAGRTHGATRERLGEDAETRRLLRNAEHTDPSPGHDDYRPDRDTALIATSYFEHERPKLLFVSLGDTDEHAHAGSYRGYLGALRRADAFVGDLVRIAEEDGSGGRDVVFFITADHGRSSDFRDHGRDYPESARAWLVAAGGPLAAHRAETKGRLRDIAPTVRQIFGLPPDDDRLAGTTLDELFEPSRARIAFRD